MDFKPAETMISFNLMVIALASFQIALLLQNLKSTLTGSHTSAHTNKRCRQSE